MRKRSILTALLIPCGLVANAALAQEDLYRWAAPTANEQLAADATVVPSGQGALFAPAMSSDRQDEPQVLVFRGDQQVASGKTGERIVVPPGEYVVHVGSGAINQMVRNEVSVTAGRTTMVDPVWGGLRIEVVDENNIAFRGTYEIIRSTDREVLGIGYGRDLLQGEPLNTWLLEPGLYRIVRSGETYRARRDFATVDVRAGSLVRFKLVQNETTGEFRGAGVVSAEEAGEAGADTYWTRRVTLGGAVSFNTTDNVAGATNQSTINGLVFLDTYVTYDDGANFGSALFELEEGVLRVDPEGSDALPTQKTQDRFRTDLLYVRFVNEHWGPYARFGILTNLFASDVLATDDVNVAFNKLDGTRDVVFVPANSEYRTADAFGSLRVREGLGINYRLARNRWATLNWRGGIGFRQNNFNDAFLLDDSAATPELDYFEIDDFNEEGLETTLVGSVRMTRNLLWITDFGVFGDFGDLGDPTIDWRNTLSLRLSRRISIDYTADILRQPQVIDETQLRQNVLLRFSWDLL